MQGRGSIYGGVRLTKNVPDHAIRTFVSRMPDEEKGNLRDIVYALEDAGLISIEILDEPPVSVYESRPPADLS